MTLAAAWKPRGELHRLERTLNLLRSEYTHLAFALEPNADPKMIGALERLGVEVQLIAPSSSRWFDARSAALQVGLTQQSDFLHYADFDRLIRWVETRPDEWRATLTRLTQSDMLILGRNPEAFGTHPRALQTTERIINAVFASTLGPVDLGAGSRGLSRRAALYLAQHSRHGGLGSDAEWPILLKRAGYVLDYAEVGGLDWEHADHFRSAAAQEQAQQKMAEQYDAYASRWEFRVEVAEQIVNAGLDALSREIVPQMVSQT